LYVLFVVAASSAAVLAYGALAVRHPVLGAACLPPLVFVVYAAGKKGRLFERIKKLHGKLN
jgi:hypothetical protein